MSSHSAASLYLAGMLAAGIGTGAWFRPGLTFTATLNAALLLLLLLALTGGIKKMYWTTAGLAFMGMGLMSMALSLPENQPRHYLNHMHPEVRSVEVRILETLKPGQYSHRYTGEVRSVDGRASKGKILLQLRKDSTQNLLLPGQDIVTPTLPGPLPVPANPGGFDYGAYLRSQGIYGRLKLSGDAYILLGKSVFEGNTDLAVLRTRLLQALERTGLGRNETRIAKALLLGDRTGVDPDLNSAYKKAGVLHLLAISGLHIGILASFLFALLSPLKRIRYGKSLRLALGLTMLWGYALLAGFSPSVVRAVLLFSFVALALYLERPGQTLHFLGLSWIFMLVAINPGWLLQVGFQLSFAAVAAIAVFYPFLYRYWPAKKYPWSYFGKLMAVSLAAQFGTLPFTLYYFHQFPGLFLLSNLVLLPGIGVVLVTGLACLALQVFSALPPLLARLLDAMLRSMNQYVQWASERESFFFEDIPMSAPEVILSVLSVLLFGIYLRTHFKKLLYGMVGVLILFQGVGIFGEVRKQQNRSWVIPHQVAHTMVWQREGPRLVVYAPDSISGGYPVRDALRHWDLEAADYAPLKNRFDGDGLSLRVLDRTGLYSPLETRPHYLLLSGSPRIHLGRLLDVLKPKVVIADGSNYTGDLARWKRSCARKGIPFHATALEGAYHISATRQ